MERDTRHFGRLARDGLDVYDQVGHERSSGFDDPRSYTLERDARVHHFTETLDQTGIAALPRWAIECVGGARVKRETLVQQPCSNATRTEPNLSGMPIPSICANGRVQATHTNTPRVHNHARTGRWGVRLLERSAVRWLER
jgi:hypothetical protein